MSVSAPSKRKTAPERAPFLRVTRSRSSATPIKTELDPLTALKNAENAGRAAEEAKFKTPSPRREGGTEARADHGKLYRYKSAFDMMFAQDCKAFRVPLSENYPQVDLSECKEPMDLGTIRKNIGKGVYNDKPEQIRDHARLTFQNVLDTEPGVFSPGMRKKATKMIKFTEKAFADEFDVEKRYTPPPTVITAMALVKDTIYGMSTGAENFLWMRKVDAPCSEDWAKLGRAPTESRSLCCHEAGKQLYCLDAYHSLWSLDMSTPETGWQLIETKNVSLVAITVLDGVLYGATSSKLKTCKVGSTEWKDVISAAGDTVEANDVLGMAAHGRQIFAYNDANELWTCDVDDKFEWQLVDGGVLPGTNGLCISDSVVVSANFDTLWQRSIKHLNGWTINSSLPQVSIKVKRVIKKTPSRMLKYDKNMQGSKKPILGIYRSSEYRKPSKGFDLPEVGRAVLDLGAHIGWFTLWCLDNGASSVISVEATPATQKFHALNFKDDPRVTSIHAAAVSQKSFEESPTATFRIAPQGNNWRNCLDRYTYWNEATTQELESVTVPCISVEKLLSEHPEVHMVKIDIEGSEMELLETVVWPEHVEYVVFEYSIGTRCCNLKCPGSIAKGCPPECAKVRFPAIRERLEQQGFYVQFGPSYWGVVTGKKAAVYDEIIFCKRVAAPKSSALCHFC